MTVMSGNWQYSLVMPGNYITPKQHRKGKVREVMLEKVFSPLGNGQAKIRSLQLLKGQRTRRKNNEQKHVLRGETSAFPF